GTGQSRDGHADRSARQAGHGRGAETVPGQREIRGIARTVGMDHGSRRGRVRDLVSVVEVARRRVRQRCLDKPTRLALGSGSGGAVTWHFMPHGACVHWDPIIVWTKVASDSVIAASYVAMALGMTLAVRNGVTLGQEQRSAVVSALSALALA